MEPWAKHRLRVVQPKVQMPIRCGDPLHRALTMQNKCLKTIRKPWHQALSQLCQLKVQVLAKVLLPTDHRQINLVTRSLEAYCHLKTREPKPLQTTSPTLSTNRPKKMPSLPKVNLMQALVMILVQPRVNMQRLRHSFRPSPCKSTRIDSWKTELRTKRRSLS